MPFHLALSRRDFTEGSYSLGLTISEEFLLRVDE
jgi:hypothetical protein